MTESRTDKALSVNSIKRTRNRRNPLEGSIRGEIDAGLCRSLLINTEADRATKGQLHMSKANPHFHRNNAQLPALATPAYRIQPFYVVDQQTCLWTMDFIMTSSAQSATSEQNLATTFNTAMATAIRGFLAADCFYVGVKVTCLTTPARIGFMFNVATANQSGQVAGNHLPSQMAAIISKYTSTKGQHGRGRFYLPGVPIQFTTPATDCDRINAAGVTAMGAINTALLGGAITDSANVALPAVTQRVAAGAAVTHGQVIAQLQSRLLLGVIRRRRVGVGK